MSAYLLTGLAVGCVSMLIIYLMARKAPKGYEDETGFHEGEEP